MSESSNLIKFKARDNGDIISIKPSSPCRHYGFEIDLEARTVQCRQCQQFVDPVFALCRYAELFSDQDYKYDKIIEFEKKESEQREKRRLKQYAEQLKTNRQQQQKRLAVALDAIEQQEVNNK